MDSAVNIQLTVNEVNIIMQTLGNLPSHSGVYPLIVNIKAQVEAQLRQQQQPQPQPPAA